MDIRGEHWLPATPEVVWKTLHDEAMLRSTIPGCKELTQTAPNAFVGSASVGVGVIKGLYKGTVELVEEHPFTGAQIRIEAKSGHAEIRGIGNVQLEAQNGGTLVHYEGDARISGPLAAVGQRLLPSVSKALTETFLKNVEEALLQRASGKLEKEGGPMAKRSVSFTLNGRKMQVDVEPRMLLVHLLRENLGLTGTHVGCDTSQCGACTVFMDGAVREVAAPSSPCRPTAPDVLTIEGLKQDERAAPAAGGVLGRARPAVRLLHARHDHVRLRPAATNNPARTRPRSREGLRGNLCRCTGYQNIVKAVQVAAAARQ